MKEHLIKQVMEIMKQIDDAQDLIKIYTFAKTYLEIQQEKGSVADEQKRHSKGNSRRFIE